MVYFWSVELEENLASSPGCPSLLSGWYLVWLGSGGARASVSLRFQSPHPEAPALTLRGLPHAGIFIPSCDEDGYYRKMQCDQSGGDCWCVDQLGLELTGTRTHGSPDCGEPGVGSQGPRFLGWASLPAGS